MYKHSHCDVGFQNHTLVCFLGLFSGTVLQTVRHYFQERTLNSVMLKFLLFSWGRDGHAALATNDWCIMEVSASYTRLTLQSVISVYVNSKVRKKIQDQNMPTCSNNVWTWLEMWSRIRTGSGHTFYKSCFIR